MQKFKNFFPHLILFAVSPFLSLSVILYDISKKRKWAIWLFIIVISLLSSYYIPSTTNDKAGYYEYYNVLGKYDFKKLYESFLKTQPDFLFYLVFYFAAQIKLHIQIVFGLITFVTLRNIFQPFFKLTKGYEGSSYIILFLLVFFAIDPQTLFSGIRFIFGASFLVLGYYNGLVEKRKFSFVWILVAMSIHFSLTPFLLLYFLLFNFKISKVGLLILFYVSVILIFLPKGLVISFLSSLNLTDSFEGKADLYINNEDFLATGAQESEGGQLLLYISMIWFYIMFIYLFITKKTYNIYRTIVLAMLVVVNFFYSVPTVHSRYSQILKLFLVYLIIYEFIKLKNRKGLIVIFIPLLILFLVKLYIIRNNISASFLNSDFLLSVMLFWKEPITNFLN